MRTKIPALLSGLLWVCACGTASFGQTAMGEVHEYLHAGISLAVPAGYQLQPPMQATDVLRSVLTEKDQPVQSVTVTSLPLGTATATAEEIADSMLEQQRNSLAVRGLQVLNKAPMKVADLPGAARFFSYQFRGEDTVAATVCFIRELPSKTRICYLISVEALAVRKNEVLPTLGDVVKTVRFIFLQRPIEMRPPELGKAVESRDRLYSLRQPANWYPEPGAPGMTFAQMDYTLGEPGVVVSVAVGDLPAGVDFQKHVEKCISTFRETSAGQKLSARVISRENSTLGGLEACQLVFEQAPSEPTTTQAASAPTTAASGPAEEANTIIVQRTAVLPGGGSSPGRSVSLVLICQDARPAAATTLANRLAEGFTFLKTRAPASSQATTASSSASTTPASSPAR